MVEHRCDGRCGEITLHTMIKSQRYDSHFQAPFRHVRVSIDIDFTIESFPVGMQEAEPDTLNVKHCSLAFPLTLPRPGGPPQLFFFGN